MKKQRGMTLLELLLASSLGLLLMGGLIDSMLTLKKVTTWQRALSNVQHRGVVATYIFRHALEPAPTNKTCDTLAQTIIALPVQNERFFQQVKNKSVSSSDILFLHRCEFVNHSYQTHIVAYYVAKTSRSIDGQSVYALYKKVDGLRAVAVLDGVRMIKLLYGEAVSGADDEEASIRFVNESHIKNAELIKLLKVSMLINSDESVLPAARAEQLGGVNVGPDRFLYQPWVVIVRVR